MTPNDIRHKYQEGKQKRCRILSDENTKKREEKCIEGKTLDERSQTRQISSAILFNAIQSAREM